MQEQSRGRWHTRAALQLGAAGAAEARAPQDLPVPLPLEAAVQRRSRAAVVRAAAAMVQDTQVAHGKNHKTGLLGKLSALGLGFRTWHPMGAPDIDIYMDDVVLDTERVGCL